MNNPTLAWALIAIGAIAVLIALFADPVDLGSLLASGGGRGG